ncbi:response regulator receiver modulated metal dependent phosphohydrolase [Burkholderia lata]|uniref:Response regulator receiver modulated metal dependent phosphohydrolase n=1 Tax=Burkholderia lata (strain ATCC 17760 / DSM 23089 / LMG 22485 / NCIMB 9086 / R18194 / 383) TaxID=482957 RepID=A0A6P2T7S3_BURL3|nr:response regulator [Burkholderia lata]VWC52145.1 response regulator receiver modulated metal dependent phosphohydrolase [Burkholderia lata]
MSYDATVLFVDDEERIVKLLKLIFQGSYRVFTATHGRAALEIVKQHQIDVVVSDQRMPEITGIELLAQVRAISPYTVRVLLTGYSDLVSIIGAVNDGEVYRFLNKPWRKEELESTLQECSARARAQRGAVPTAPSAKPVAVADLPTPLANATKLLALEGVASDRHELMEMFTEDYDVLGASTINEALEIMRHHDIGVVVANTFVNGQRTAELLAALKRHAPSIVAVVLTTAADSDLVIDLINRARIYRVAIKPIQPNVFRLAVSAAMREHHRLCAGPDAQKRLLAADDESASSEAIVESIVQSLRRFTEVQGPQGL